MRAMETVLSSHGFQSVVPGPTATASSENLLKMHILRPRPDLLDQELGEEQVAIPTIHTQV